MTYGHFFWTFSEKKPFLGFFAYLPETVHLASNKEKCQFVIKNAMICHQKRNDLSFPLPHLLTTLTYKSQTPIDGACGYGGHEIAMRV
jgi:hypothetical protein